jgi:glycosyltransferase involved in cell wall biosynthesis
MTCVPTVLIVCGAGIVSGKEIVSLHLARGLRDVGWNSWFLTSEWGDGEFARRLEYDGFRYQRLRLGFISASVNVEPMLMTLDQLRYWPSLAYGYVRAVKKFGPRAVIHTNWHHALLLLPFLKARRDIFWAHELFPNAPHYSHVLRAIAKRVGRIVCVSHAVARSVRILGVPESRVTVIHNGLPPIESGSELGVQATLRLGIVGQIGAWKGHEDLIEALALLARDGIRVSLRIFGTGAPDYVESMKHKVSELNLEKSVEWRGFIADPKSIYADIDVCIVPSRSDDPLPTAALEGGAFGRPVVGTSRGGLPEIIENGVTGFVIEARRPDQLAQAIKSFAYNPDLVKTMGEAARNRIRSEFSLDQCVRQFTQVVEELNV